MNKKMHTGVTLSVATLLVLTAVAVLPTSALAAVWNEPELVDESAGEGSLALDASGNPHISYSAGGDLMYAYYDGTTWHKEPVYTEGRSSDSSLALDASGNPHIIYEGSEYEAGTGIMYAYHDGTTWHIEPIEKTYADDPDIAIDASGTPHISYFVWDVPSNRGLTYAYHDGTTWQKELRESLALGSHSSIALDASGNPHITYTGISTIDGPCINYTYYDGYHWHASEKVDRGASGGPSSLAIDANGFPHVSYCSFDSTNYFIKYAYHDGTIWHPETVDSVSVSTSQSSLALDASGNPHISYGSDTEDSDLMYAYYDGTTWQKEPVDTEGYGGRYSSLALDSSGYAHISYSEDGDLKYIRVGAPTTLTATATRTTVAANRDIEITGTLTAEDGTPIALATIKLQKLDFTYDPRGVWTDVPGASAHDRTNFAGEYTVITSESTEHTYAYRTTFAGDRTLAASISNRVTVHVDTRAAATQVLGELRATLDKEPDSVFYPGTRRAMEAVLRAAELRAHYGRYLGAATTIELQFLTRTDGCALRGTPDRTDLVRTCDAQAQLYPQALHVVKELKSLQGK